MRGRDIKREASPLFDSLYAGAIIGEFCRATSSKVQSYGVFKRGYAPLL
jgi:hypothetical protein